MDSKDKMAITGAGLVVAGFGLGILGVALLTPALIGRTVRLVEKGADGIASKLEGASKTVGTVAGTLHRSFSEATKAGVAEMKRKAAG